MTDQQYTHLSLVIDRSGSMHRIRSDAQGGLDLLLDDQFALPGRLTLTLVEFDTHVDMVHRMATERPPYTLVPRGSTALLDAVGRTLAVTGEDLAALPEEQRPAHVLFCVVTDGEENASSEWAIEDLKAKIEEQKSVYGWHFLFVGADTSAWQGEGLGMAHSTFNSATPGSSSAMYAGVSAATTSIRSGQASTYDVPDVP